MDLKQLKSFIAVANTLNFGRAARQLHLSQSALSVQIQSLEAHLGVSLLDRNRRSVRLTPAGESVLADSEQLLQQIAAMELRAARIGSGERGHLRIGFVASATAQLIPSIVVAFRKAYPGISFDLKIFPRSTRSTRSRMAPSTLASFGCHSRSKAILPEQITKRSHSTLAIRPLSGERIISEIGIALPTNSVTPLAQRFANLSKQIGLR